MARFEEWIDRAKSSYELSKAKISNIIYKDCKKLFGLG